MFRNVPVLVGLHVTEKYRDEKHEAYMLQQCSLSSSQCWRIKLVSPCAFPHQHSQIFSTHTVEYVPPI